MNYTYAVHELIMRDEHRPENWTEWAALEADESRDPPLHCERPGRDIHANADGFWYNVTIANSTGCVLVHAMALRHTIPSLGWLILQPSPPRKLDALLARRLGVPDGPMMGQLKKGIPVSISGQSITPDQVLGEQVRGKRVAIMGDSYDSSQLERLMHTLASRSLISSNGAYQLDVLVHEATLENAMAEDALQKGHSTPGQVSELAARLNVHLLILTHFSQRYQAISGSDQHQDGITSSGERRRGSRKPSLQVLLDEAKSVSSFKGDVVLAEDLSVIQVPPAPL